MNTATPPAKATKKTPAPTPRYDPTNYQAFMEDVNRLIDQGIPRPVAMARVMRREDDRPEPPAVQPAIVAPPAPSPVPQAAALPPSPPPPPPQSGTRKEPAVTTTTSSSRKPATERFDTLVNEQVRQGKTRAQAVAHVKAHDRETFIDMMHEANPHQSREDIAARYGNG